VLHDKKHSGRPALFWLSASLRLGDSQKSAAAGSSPVWRCRRGPEIAAGFGKQGWRLSSVGVNLLLALRASRFGMEKEGYSI